MIQPNTPARPIDLSDHIHYGCLIPNWLQYAFGHSQYQPAVFLCPVCGSAKMGVDPDVPASVFTERTHHEVDFQNGTVKEAFDSGKLTGCFSFMACLKCENGHSCQMDLNFEGHGSDCITFSVLLTKQEYVELHTAEAQKWGDDEDREIGPDFP